MGNFEKYNHLKFGIKEPVLDIGGGRGEMMVFFKVKDATIIDFNKSDGKRYKFIQADITKRLPELKRKFKTIFLFEVLEHIRNPLYLMAQVYDLLEDDGTVYISFPYTEIHPTHHHVSRWTKKEILQQMDKLGFRPRVIWQRRRFKNLGFWLPHCWLTLELKKRINNGGGDSIRFYSKNNSP
jgi:cyclopropane fatty-acyl-phospholipid synthase-like methyltransferase